MAVKWVWSLNEFVKKGKFVMTIGFQIRLNEVLKNVISDTRYLLTSELIQNNEKEKS